MAPVRDVIDLPARLEQRREGRLLARAPEHEHPLGAQLPTVRDASSSG